MEVEVYCKNNVPWGITSSTESNYWLVDVIQSYRVFSTPSMGPACGPHTTRATVGCEA